MRVMQTQFMDLFTIIDSHFQPSISQAINMAVIVQMVPDNSGKCESESSCAYYYLFLFSGWWFNDCTNVALNGKYNPTIPDAGFQWYNDAINYIQPNRSEMKIRRQQ